MNEITADYIAKILNKIQQTKPIIHCITNSVSTNDCANALLAIGASPTMAYHPLEVEEITKGASVLVLNLGATSDFEAMVKAGLVAYSLNHAIVLDPVGIAASSYRRNLCKSLIEKIHPTCIKGNYSEIRALLEDHNTANGVDSCDKTIDIEALKRYAIKHQTIMIASGKKDIITDGVKTLICENGDPMMAKITGSGCMASAVLGAFESIETNIDSAVACCVFMGLAGEYAAKKTIDRNGATMTFRNLFIDEISMMTKEKMEKRIRVSLI